MNYEELTKATKEDVKDGIDDGLGGIYSKDGKRLLKYTNSSAEEYTVKEGTEIICKGAFDPFHCMKSLKHVFLPESVSAIGAYAFQLLCKLSFINLPSNLHYIGDKAFDKCTSLRKIVLPPCLSYLGTEVFSGTRCNLKIVSNSTAFKVENGALLNADGTRLLLVKTNAERFLIPATVKAIDGEAFDAPNMRCLTIPNNVETMGLQDLSKGKRYNNLRVIAILNPELKLEKCTWRSTIIPGRGIIAILVPDGSKAYFARHIEFSFAIQEISESELNYISQPNYDFCQAIPNEAIYSEDGKTLIKYRGTESHYDVKSGTEVISENAFAGNSALKYIHFPNTVVKIGRDAFNHCWCLQKLILPDSVKVIDEGAFRNCSNLESVSFSRNLDVIGNQAFYGCESIKEIELPEGLTTIGDMAFCACSKLSRVLLPTTLIELQGFNDCENLGIIEVPTSVKVIKEEAFYESNIKKLILHEGLEKIEKNAFGCSKIGRVRLPNSVMFIGDNAFIGSDLKSINIPPETKLGKHNPFEGLTVRIDCQNPHYNLIDDVLYSADGKKIIAYLSDRKNFHVPETVEVIGQGAFGNNPHLQNLYLSKKVKCEDKIAYLWGELHIPKELENDYKDVIAYQRQHAVID